MLRDGIFSAGVRRSFHFAKKGGMSAGVGCLVREGRCTKDFVMSEWCHEREWTTVMVDGVINVMCVCGTSTVCGFVEWATANGGNGREVARLLI